MKNTNDFKIVGVFLCLLVFSAPPLLNASPARSDYNPFATRDQNPFNLIHGQPLPVNGRLIEPSQSQWTSSLAITNTVNIESSAREDIYLDYESYRFNLSYQYGLNKNWNLQLDLPLVYQGAGVFDSPIDNWHRFFGLPLGQRPQVEDNQLTTTYSNQAGTAVNLDDPGATLGDIQLAAARSLITDNSTDLSLWASLKLPTGDKNKLSGNGAVDVAAWLALNQKITDNWLINLNSGALVAGKDEYRGMPLSDYVLYGHIMLGWLVTDNINLKLQLQGHTSYYEQSQLKILGDTYLLMFGGSVNIGECQLLDIAMTEDIKVEASPDISLLISWRYAGQC